MCGILACIYCQDRQKSVLKEALLPLLCRRGPDHTGEVSLPLGTSPPPLWLGLVGTLLHMRGGVTPQPLGNEAGDCLLWNGNVFGGGIDIYPGENDTMRVMQELEVSQEGHSSGVLRTLSKVHGPWAFVYWQSSTGCLWFGRDVFGRRSLLWHLPINGSDVMAISSVGCRRLPDMPQGYWSEIPAGVYCLQVAGGVMSLVHYPWMHGDCIFQERKYLIEVFMSQGSCLPTEIVENITLQVPFCPLNRHIIDPSLARHIPSPPPDMGVAKHIPEPSADMGVAQSDLRSPKDGILDLSGSPGHMVACSSEQISGMDWSTIAQTFLDVLQMAVKRRVDRAPFPSSIVLGPSDVGSGPSDMGSGPSDMGSGPSDMGSGPSDMGSGLGRAGFPLCMDSIPIPSNLGSGPSHDGLVPTSLLPSNALASCTFSVEGSAPALESSALESSYKCMHLDGGRRGVARVAILFSGGVDSTVLAALTDRCLDPSEEIDLINVAFEQKGMPNSEEPNFDVPDRLSAIQSLNELNPLRTWNLVLVNVTQDEVNYFRKDHISHLVYPLCTVLDDSIGCALWFAARGKGVLYSDQNTHYTSAAKTLFIGIGADEQLGGYARHRTKFRSEGWEGLVKEIEMETKRLSKRNLGRDDRCVADHQRDGQFPFLDETVVNYLQKLPMTCKLDLTLPRGVGEKRLLREVASILGCHVAAALPKRAIQFGSRMAKLAGSSNSRELGSDVCSRLLASDD